MTFSWNKLFNYKDIKNEQIQSKISTAYMYCICKMKGIRLGKNCKFTGLAKFKRSESGQIEIGNNCTLLSLRIANLLIFKPCSFAAAEKDSLIHIGSNCGFSGVSIICGKEIRIGNDVRCGANTLIMDSDWHFEDVRSGGSKPVLIGDNVWLGSNVVILKGVSIGENTVIASNSVVFQSIPANTVAAGNPCIIVFNPASKNKSRKNSDIKTDFKVEK